MRLHIDLVITVPLLRFWVPEAWWLTKLARAVFDHGKKTHLPDLNESDALTKHMEGSFNFLLFQG